MQVDPLQIESCKILLPHHDASVEPSIRRLTHAETCAVLMPSIFDFVGNEKEIWPTLAKFVARSQAYDWHFGDASLDLDLALAAF